ncbi:MAG: dihydrofolate reductase family protein [Candidatus Dormiibacterota bacterium]
MAKLIYSAITSVDGYVADQAGNFEWGAPDEEVFGFINELERTTGTYLYGRRMYQVMVYWETAHFPAELSTVEQDFADLWRRADKVVYTSTLETVSSARTRIERKFDLDVVQGMKAAAAHDISVAGATLATQAFQGGLVDECHLFLTPVVVGGGQQALPQDIHLKLELVDERRFSKGVVYLHYAIRN